MKGDIVSRSELSIEAQADMYALFASQFSGVSAAEFLRDLDDKNWVLLLRRDDGALAGFSSMHVYMTAVGGCEMSFV